MTDQHQGASARAARTAPPQEPGYPGKDLGFPEAGSGSIAGMGRRVVALLIDWLLCTFIVVAIIRPARQDVEYWTLLVFAAQEVVLTGLTGFTIGKRLLGMRVVRLDGRMIGPAWSLVRTFLMLLVVPALVADADTRGMHDRASNTAVVRL